MIDRLIYITFICSICLSSRAQLPSKLEFRIYDSISGKAVSPNDSCYQISVMLFGRDDGLGRTDVENTLFADYILQQKYKDGELIDSSIVEKGHFIFQESTSIQDLTTRRSYIASWMAARDLLIIIHKKCPTGRQQMMQIFLSNVEGAVDLGVIKFYNGVYQTPEIISYIQMNLSELERDIDDTDILLPTHEILSPVDTNFHPVIQLPRSVKIDSLESNYSTIGGKKMSFNKDFSRIGIVFESNYSDYSTFTTKYNLKHDSRYNYRNFTVFRFTENLSIEKREEIIELIKEEKHVEVVGDLLIRNQGASIITDKIIVQWKETDSEEIIKILRKENLSKQMALKGNRMLLKVQNPFNYRVIEVCNKLMNSGLVDFVEPDLFSPVILD